MPLPKPSRRDVLKALGLGAIAAAAGAGVLPEAPNGAATPGSTPVGEALPMPMSTLGKAKIPISRIAVGGHHMGVEMPEDRGLELLERALALGINFFDSAHSYGRAGESELRLGKAFAGRRDKVVLMSKSTQRSASEAERELDLSLQRLGTDHVDIWQFHAITHMSDAEQTAAPGGAAEVARRALADGRVRVLGATSHTAPEPLNRLLDLVPEIEAVQFPVNCVDRHWKSFIDGTIPKAQERGLTILAMKCLARGTLTQAAGIAVAEAHRYALSQPVAAWVSGMTSLAQLEENVAVTKAFRPMPAEEQADLLARSMPFKGPQFEDYKTWGL